MKPRPRAKHRMLKFRLLGIVDVLGLFTATATDSAGRIWSVTLTDTDGVTITRQGVRIDDPTDAIGVVLTLLQATREQ